MPDVADATLIPGTDLAALLEAVERADGAAAARTAKAKLWRALAGRVLIHWDGRSAAFFDDVLTPGQRAVVCTSEMDLGIAGGDLESFVTCSTFYAVRVPAALATLKADEYLAVFERFRLAFPGGKFPEYAEDVVAAARAVPASLLRKTANAIVKGTGMRRPLCDYVHDYVRGNAREFARG